MCVPTFVGNQLRAFNGGMVIVATCFSAIALYASYTVLALFMMLVQYRIDTHSAYNTFATTTDYLNSLPDWVSVAYQWENYLLLALLIWISINLLHWIIRIVYPHWLAAQKEKYPMSY